MKLHIYRLTYTYAGPVRRIAVYWFVKKRYLEVYWNKKLLKSACVSTQYPSGNCIVCTVQCDICMLGAHTGYVYWCIVFNLSFSTEHEQQQYIVFSVRIPKMYLYVFIKMINY